MTAPAAAVRDADSKPVTGGAYPGDSRPRCPAATVMPS